MTSVLLTEVNEKVDVTLPSAAWMVMTPREVGVTLVMALPL